MNDDKIKEKTTEELYDGVSDLKNQIKHGEMGHPRGPGIEVPADGKMREFELTESENKEELPPIADGSEVSLESEFEVGNAKDPIIDDSTPLPVPDQTIPDDQCQQCGAKIHPGQNFCEDNDCELQYGFSGVSAGVLKRYLKVMENVKLFKERNARA